MAGLLAMVFCAFLHTVTTALACCIFTAAAIVLYRLFFHPLSLIPGPRLAAISSIWYAHHVRDGRMLKVATTLHKKYGPAVRVGPNEVWFDSREAFSIIYGAGRGYEKAEFYLATKLNKPEIDWNLNLHFGDTLDLLSELDVERYRLQRRIMGPVYQTANIKKFEHAVDGVICQVVAKLRALDGAEIDLKEWMHIVAVECLGAIVLSWSPGYIRDESDGGTSTQSYLGWKRKSVFGLFPAVTKVAFFSKTVGRMFSNLWGVTFPTPKNFKPFFTPVYRRASKRIAAAMRRDEKPAAQDTRQDLLTDLIQLHKDRPEFSETYLRRLAVTNFGAGHETMCSALTSIMTMIGSHPEVAAHVRQELSSLGPASAVISYDDAIRLRYTQASIKEAQRLHPVIGMSLPRKVPPSGLLVHGYHIPPRTTVGCNPVSLHRNADIFGVEPDTYRPERWLAGDEAATRAMDKFNLTWGGGGRTCPGRHLAEVVLYKVVPALVNEFDIEVVSTPQPDEVRYYFMAMLTGVRARFRPVGGTPACDNTNGGVAPSRKKSRGAETVSDLSSRGQRAACNLSTEQVGAT
ncbi:hypothetical protein OQA88_7080 [Cercophora sp. LCS_1]